MTRLFALLMICSSLAFAQVPGMFPWWDSPLARDLDLTDQQDSQIRETIRTYRDRLIELRAETQKAEGEFLDLMNEKNVDVTRGDRVIDRLVNARGELTRAFSELTLKMRSILTAEQWDKLQERQRRRGPGRGPGDRRFPRGGPGGGGPGGPPANAPNQGF